MPRENAAAESNNERVTVYLSPSSADWIERCRAYLGLSKSAMVEQLIQRHGPALERTLKSLD